MAKRRVSLRRIDLIMKIVLNIGLALRLLEQIFRGL